MFLWRFGIDRPAGAITDFWVRQVPHSPEDGENPLGGILPEKEGGGGVTSDAVGTDLLAVVEILRQLLSVAHQQERVLQREPTEGFSPIFEAMANILG